ncbi:hypothetical protein SBBP1_530003 [Burkholderiales bacterium]|nr:hypothetical protein SBBP1_530003 [Burkholderiales bacterium]
MHHAPIDHGALPLTVLAPVIDKWIETERTRPASGAPVPRPRRRAMCGGHGRWKCLLRSP